MLKIFTDSGANIPATVVEEFDISVIPFINYTDGEAVPGFVPGLSLEEERAQGKKYYDDMRKGKEVKTSLINSYTFEEAFRPVLDNGDDIIHFSISKNISGTFNAARNAVEDLMEEYPDRKIYLVDSLNASLGEGFLAIYASIMRSNGVSGEEIYRVISDTVSHMNGVFTVNDLKYLAKTGRISNIKSFAGNMLSIKPILKGSSEGFIVQCENIRGRKKAVKQLIDLFCNNIICPEKQIVGIAHADAYEEASFIMDEIQSRIKVKRFIDTSYDFCTGAHVGPDTLAVFFIGSDRELTGAKEGALPELFQYM